MRVVKPLTQSLLHQKIDYDKKSYLSIISAVFFDFKSQKLCSEQELWEHYNKESIGVFNAEALDLCGRKKQPELVVNGYAYGRYAIDGRTAVQVSLNNVKKTLTVWGDRYWDNGEPSKPQDFEQIAVSWSNAYGGKNFEQNPHGKGRTSVEINGAPFKFLPNIEAPSNPIVSENKEYLPAGLGSLSIGHPDRRLLMGSYDERWREEEFPGLARDFDWAYYNQAPKDQHLSYLSPGDEAIFTGMHPEYPELCFVIPELKSKAFLRLAKDKKLKKNFLKAVDLNLSTLWAFPHLEKGILIYEGFVEVERWFFIDDIVSDLMGALEHTERPRSLTYYEEVFCLRSDPIAAPYYADKDRQLTDEQFLKPEEKLQLGPALKNKLKKLIRDLRELEKNQQENKRQFPEFSLSDLQSTHSDVLESIDMDFSSLLVSEFGEHVRTLDDLEKLLEEGFSLEGQSLQLLEQEQKEKSVLQLAREHKKEMREAMDGMPVQSQLTKHELRGVQRERKKYLQESVLANTDIFMQDREFKNLKAQTQFTAPSIHHEYYHKAQQGKEDYLKENDATISQKALQQLYAANGEKSQAVMVIESLSFFKEEIDDVEDINVFELKAKSFKQQNYQKYLIDGVCISQCHFVDCDFSKAELSDVQFIDCSFKACKFETTEVIKSVLESCVFTDCNLAGLQLDKATLNRNHFVNCSINYVEMSQSSLYEQRFEDCVFEQTSFLRSRLNSVFFQSSEMKQISFTKGKIDSVTFESCAVESVAFLIESLIKNLIFRDSQISKIFSKATSRFINLTIINTDDRESSWRGLQIENIIIQESRMENSDFSKTHMCFGEIKATSFRDSLWMSSFLEKISLDKVSFAETVMMGFKTFTCYFKKVTFFSAELSYSDIDAETVFEQCSMDRVNTVPALRAV